MKNIPIFWPNIYKKEVMKELSDTLNGRWLGQGPKVKKFEELFGKKFGYKYPLFVNSGTAALELAYHLVGIKEGDEVIVPILDCTAGQTGLKRRGAKIVFADIEQNTLNMSPIDLKRKITKKTKAIVAVHLGGIPVDDEIFKIAKKHKIPVIVDAAQHHVGNLKGDYVCYSFQAIKHMTTCDGGMLVLKSEKDFKRAKLLRWFGIDREAKERHNYQAWERRHMTFDIVEAGYKYQPTDVDACFGIVGLKHVDEVIKYRQELVEEYRKYLRGVDEIQVVAGGSCWLMGILAKKRDELGAFLIENGIDTNMVHLRNDIFKIFGGKRENLPFMNTAEKEYLYLPLNAKVTKKDVRFICKKIKEFYKI